MKREEVRKVFEGIAAGDGDTGSRIASSYPSAETGYPQPLAALVVLANKFYADGTISGFSEKEKQDWIEKSVQACDRIIRD